MRWNDLSPLQIQTSIITSQPLELEYVVNIVTELENTVKKKFVLCINDKKPQVVLMLKIK